ncbi:MAG: hypothetical protein B6244_12875 [Candidatus Cloacimonetes bacterium 4572_55]|nr:MAG: hypothetical protein B6244_12875 [Candidatus Cloacimonetes bacterium 4572_55]
MGNSTSNIQAVIQLKPNRDKLLRSRHPWVFSGAIAKRQGAPKSGQVVSVVDSYDKFIGYGSYSPRSNIRVRLLEWNESNRIDENWWQDRLAQAIARRGNLAKIKGLNSYRLIYSEADLLPGLIVDKYNDFLVMQTLTVGMEKLKMTLAEMLFDLVKPAGIYERSDSPMRREEGLKPCVGKVCGDEPPPEIEVKESGFWYGANLRTGHKTGFYLDQRDNRRIIALYARDRRVLDCFSYTGSFAVHCLASGAQHVTLIDSSRNALEVASENMRRNKIREDRSEFVRADLFNQLRVYRDQNRKFDMVILDPPKLAPRRSDLNKAERAYKDANLIGMKLLVPGGILATFSCSAAIDPTNFRRIVAWAGSDAGREIHLLRQLSQGEDHPIRLSFPESEYLKGLVCRIL